MDFTNEEIASVLDEAVELMNDKGAHWIQGAFKTLIGADEYAYCSIGAIREVAMGREGSDTKLVKLQIRAAEALADALPSSVYSSVDKVIVWNDDSATTWNKVRLRFRRAAKALRSQ